MHLSVIIPCLNASETIGEQLRALANQSWSEPWEVIVSDNGSTDESAVIVDGFKKRLPNLRIVDSSDRKGAAHARNVGARAANGEALLFCDADDVVGDGWLSAIGKALLKHDFVASRWDMETLNTTFAQICRMNPQESSLNEYTYPPYLKHSGASGLGIKRSIHETIGGFDESLLCLEDTDYCWRVQLAGTKLHFVPDAVVNIRCPNSYWGLFKQALNWADYNVLLYKKYRPLGMPKLSPRQGFMEWKRALRNILKIRNRKAFARCLWQLAWRIGRLRGSVRYRVFAL